MTRFYAQDLINVSAFIEALKTYPEAHKWEWDEKGRNSLKAFLEGYIPTLRNLGCDHSANNVTRFCARGIDHCENWKECSIRADALRDGLIVELESKVCLALSESRRDFWEKDSLDILGKTCAKRFPSIRYDIEHGVRCFAISEYTACVFHFMRATEGGLVSLAKALGLYDPDNKNWGKFFKDFEVQYDTYLKDKKNASFPWGKHGDFLKEMQANFKAINNAWRNQTMHLDVKYDEPEAAHVIAIIPKFLKKVSERLDERGQWV